MPQCRRIYFFPQSVRSLKINPVLLLKFAVSSPHKNISLIEVHTFHQDKVQRSSSPMGERIHVSPITGWRLRGELSRQAVLMVRCFEWKHPTACRSECSSCAFSHILLLVLTERSQVRFGQEHVGGERESNDVDLCNQRR